MRYSKYQEEIFNEVEKGNSNLVINAVAGSGKTTTIVECCKRLSCERDRVKFLAFNKSIVQELESRIGSYADVSTMHAFALSIIKKAYNNKLRHRYVKIDNNRWGKYIADTIYSLSDEITPDTDKKAVFKFRCNVTKVFNLARVNLIKCEDVAAIRSIMADYGITPMFDEIDVISKLLAQAYTMPKNLTIDFTDMLTIAATELRNDIPTFDYVFIDECQDLSKVQREIMLVAARNGKFIAVGDKRQAINGFCGADAKSFESIVSIPNTKVLPLSVNYRCGRKMIELAQGIVPQITACDNAIEGIVEKVKKLELGMFHEGDMVLCRKYGPLVQLCLSLIKSGKLANVKGNELASELRQMFINADCEDFEGVVRYTENELSKLREYLMKTYGMDCKAAEATKPYMALSDKCECMLHLAKEAGGKVKELIDKVFSEKNMEYAINLMTIHKAKGLESDRVIFLSPKLDMKKSPKMRQWQFEQEKNLQYVAITRARKELILCYDCEGVEEEGEEEQE